MESAVPGLTPPCSSVCQPLRMDWSLSDERADRSAEKSDDQSEKESAPRAATGFPARHALQSAALPQGSLFV